MDDQRLISFDLQADFAFFKKPDYNDGLLLTYNMIHKPALLGILGAVIGLKGYKEKGELPEYFQRLKDIPLGIEPLEGLHDKGNFSKTIVRYTNTVGYANRDGNLLVEESMLIKPGYRCYLLLSENNEDHLKLYENLKAGRSEYIPYLGKNEYQAWFGDSFREYEFDSFVATKSFKIVSLFVKEGIIKGKKINTTVSFDARSVFGESSFVYFERLPIGFNTNLMQYELAEFAFMDWELKPDTQIADLYELKCGEKRKIIQLF